MADDLSGLGLLIKDTSQVETDVIEAAKSHSNSKLTASLTKKLDKLDLLLGKLKERLDRLKDKNANINPLDRLKDKNANINPLEGKIQALSDERAHVVERIESIAKNEYDSAVKTSREYLISTGQITPFELPSISEVASSTFIPIASHSKEVSINAIDYNDANDQIDDIIPALKLKKVRTIIDEDEEDGLVSDKICIEGDDSSDEFTLDKNALKNNESDLSDDFASEVDDDRLLSQKITYEDDGNELKYQRRLSDYVVNLRLKKIKKKYGASFDENKVNIDALNEDISQEMFQSHEDLPDYELKGGLKVPGALYDQLFGYQKTCIKWLWELHQQETGGVLGDEMGLGKTVQIIAFLASLAYSNKLDGPILVVVPATVLKNWINEFHQWWPFFRVVILHSSGSGMISSGGGGNRYEKEDDCESFIDSDDSEDEKDVKKVPPAKRRRKNYDSDFESSLSDGDDRQKKKVIIKKPVPRASKSTSIQVSKLIDRIALTGHVVVTTYAAVRLHKKLIETKFAYCILDEGHKIRNPDSSVTISCKQIKTHHRIVLSGTPIQNNLVDLWSVYDFVYPGKLGTLPVFQTQFAVPINIGGYVNASKIQIETAHKCAAILQDAINPYLLRRMKSIVATDLPEKTEQVLFCRLTDFQRDSYIAFLNSHEVASIMEGKRQALYGIDILRKICNHPDLLEREVKQYTNDYGNEERSCKMKVVGSLLKMWQVGGHRSLLFCQTRQMLNILERFVKENGFKYFRMDGSTAIKNRQHMVDTFNSDASCDVFLLTTKVGGLGINLTGADRVVIYDPDWNPATDGQAKDRSFRIGQKKNVTIYRLITSGTIEEKIYHRQIFKTFLTNKVLNDPKQQRFFKSNDMRDLFSLNIPKEGGTETGDLFAGIDDVEMTKTADVGAGPKKKKSETDLESADLKQIRLLDKVSEYKGQEDAKADEDEHDILKSLFDKGVHSALKHDAIMSTSHQEAMLVNKEAELVASKAVAALKASRNRIRKQQAEVGTPTWTGRFGSAGAPKRHGLLSTAQSSLSGIGIGKNLSSSAAPSSALILGKLRERQLQDHPETLSSVLPSAGAAAASSSPPITPSFTKGSREEYVLKIRDFLAGMPSGDFRASTSQIVSHFKIAIKSEDVALFRKMLKGIAHFEKGVPIGGGKKGGGYWVLKEEFR